MVAHQIEPTAHFEPLIMPTPPAYPCAPRAEGFKLNRKTDQYELSPSGRDQAAICQRMVLSYALGFENRAALSERYGYAARHVQSVLSGETYAWLTREVRERLEAHGISVGRQIRESRNETVRRALEKLAAQAVEYLRWPHLYTYEEKEQVATDLYLLSGAWREDAS